MNEHTKRIKRPKAVKRTASTKCDSAGCSNTVAPRGDGSGYYRTHCGTCINLRGKYGITLPERTASLARQDSRCLICSSVIQFKSGASTGKANAVVDHDHKTGVVRGIICGSCNIGLGKFYDNPEHLRKAADYLERQD